MLGIYKKVIKLLLRQMPFLSLRRAMLRSAGYSIGTGAYIPADLVISDLKTHRKNVRIGDRVSLGPRVTIITDSSPNNSLLLKKFPMLSKEVVIEDDAWIGAGVIILPGVSIGKCAVIGAGAVVNNNIPAYAIAAGVPAKVIDQIDPQEI